MIEVGSENAQLKILLARLQEATEEASGTLTVAEIVGALECTKTGFMLNNILGYDEQEPS